MRALLVNALELPVLGELVWVVLAQKLEEVLGFVTALVRAKASSRRVALLTPTAR